MTDAADRVVWEADEEALYRAARATGLASRPQGAPEGVPIDQGARQARYAEAMRRSPNGPWMTLPGPTDIAPSFVHAVLPLVDAEVAAAVSEAQAERDEARRLLDTMDHHFAEVAETCERKSNEWAARVRVAEAEVDRLREGIRALADAPPGDCEGAPCIWPDDLRALLSPSPAATTGFATPGGSPAGTYTRDSIIPTPVLGWASSEIGGAVSAKPGWWLPDPPSSGEAATGEAGRS